MSHLQTAGSTANSQLQTVVLSFIGTMVAIAVSFAIFSLTQTASAEGTAKTADFDKYAQAYMAGLTSNQQQTNGSGNVTGGCEAPETKEAPISDGQAVSYHKTKADLVKSVTNSYNNYMSNTTTLTNSYEKNINSKNTSSTNVDVSDSNGAVVTTNTSTSGDNENKVEVDNEDSNNSTVIEDSFNKDSHDDVVVVKDSFNETNTEIEIKKDTTIINDSFNKVEVELNTGKDEHHPKQHVL